MTRTAPFAVLPTDPPPLGDCRQCGRPSWRADAAGPAHPCCVLANVGADCPACRASLSLHRGRSER